MLDEKQEQALKDSGFWDLISADVALFKLEIITKEQFQECVVKSSDMHKQRIVDRENQKNEILKLATGRVNKSFLTDKAFDRSCY